MSEPILRKAVGAVVALSTLALLSGAIGCGIGTPAAPLAPVPVAGGTIQGTVMGGEQPISGATIQLYAVGTTGYGTGATALIAASNTTAPTTGAFTITGDYTCPSASSLVYLTASGGNAGSGANSAIELAAVLGECGPLTAGTTHIVINEVTTAAAAFALGQYFTPSYGGAATTDLFGAPNTTQAQLGITNAFATAARLAQVSSGQAYGAQTLTGAGATVTATPETAKLNTIADILASCVNTAGGASGDGSNCGVLFGDTHPTGGTPATDTLQAAVYLSLNPTSNNANGSSTNLTSLYGLVGATPPFPAQSTQPTDWTVGIQYQDATANGTFFQQPQNLAVDGYGNVWVLSYGSQESGVGALAEVGPTGTPLSDISTLSEEGPFSSTPPSLSSPKTTTTTISEEPYVFTTTFGQATNNPGISPRNLAIDPTNNIWFTQTSSVSSTTGGSNGASTVATNGAVYEIMTSGGTPDGSTYGFSTGKSAFGLAIDGSGDAFVGEESSGAYFNLYEFPYNATPGATFATPIAFPIATATPGTAGATTANNYLLPQNMAFDMSGTLWIDSGSPSTINGATNNYVVDLSGISLAGAGVYNSTTTSNSTPCTSPLTADMVCQTITSTTENTYTGYTLTGSVTEPYGLAADTLDMVVADSGTGNGVNFIPYATPASNTLTGTNATFTTPRFPAVDGAGNVWVADGNGTPVGAGATPGGSVTEVSSTGTVLSPTSSSTTTVNPGFVHAGLNSGYGTAVDPSGNVWVANYIQDNPSASPPVAGSIFEIVGAAAPTVTPIALALKNSTVAQKP